MNHGYFKIKNKQSRKGNCLQTGENEDNVTLKIPPYYLEELC